jgi:hypothetical protein
MKWLLATVAAIVVLAIAAAALLPILVDTPRIQSLIASSASHVLARPVKFGSLSVRVFPMPAIELHRLEVAEDRRFGSAPFLTLDRGTVRLRLGALLTGRLEFGDLVLEQPLISLVRNADGRWNIASLASAREASAVTRPGSTGSEPRSTGGAAALPVPATHVKIANGVVTYVSRAGSGSAPATYRLDQVNLTLTGGGSAIALRGAAVMKPGDVRLQLSDGVLVLHDARPLQEATLRGQARFEAGDIGRLAPPGLLGGAMKGNLTLSGTVGAARASGEVTLSEVTVRHTSRGCRPPVERRLTLGTVEAAVAWSDRRLTGRDLATSLAGAPITANLVVALDHGPRVELTDLATKGLSLERLLVDFLCHGYAVAGPLELAGSLAFHPGDPWNTLSGEGRLAIGRGRVVGPQALALLGGVTRVGGALASLLGADPATASSPLDFESITATYRIRNGVASSRDLLYTSRALKVAAGGDYALGSGRVNVDVVVDHARGSVRAKVTGTTASPEIRVSRSTALRDADPQKAERGLQELLRRFR